MHYAHTVRSSLKKHGSQASQRLLRSRLFCGEPRTSVRADLPDRNGVWRSKVRHTKPESAIVLVVGLVALIVCPAAAEPDPPVDQPTIAISAAGAMVPLTTTLATHYMQLHPDVTIDVHEEKVAPVVARLGEGKCVIAASPRPATKKELRHFRHRRQTDLVGTPIAMDAVVLFVHSINTGVASLTLDQLRAIYTHKMDDWSELGLITSEAAPIRRLVPMQSSGCAEVLRARAMDGKGFTTALVESESTREVVNETAADESALGFAGMGYSKGVRTVPVRATDASPPVAANIETVQSRAYPLSHYLYWYTAGQPTGHVREFIRFALSPEGQKAVEDANLGPVPLPLVGR